MCKVLVVEDSEEMLSNIAAILSLNGFEVLAARDGREGLTSAKNNFPDVIVSDVMMPVMNGYEMLDAVRGNEVLQTTPFIFLTAKVDRSEIRTGMASGADDYITKPFKSTELIDAINAQMKKKERVAQKYSEIAHNISSYMPHELRTPLVAIMGYTDLLINDLSDWDKESITNMLINVKKASSRLYKTIEKFIRYSEIELMIANRKEYFISPDESISAKENIYYRAGEIAAHYSRSQDLNILLTGMNLKISEEHFGILIDEIIDNAFKFSSKNDAVEIKDCNTEFYYMIEITNKGCGMSQSGIDNIVPFFQFNRKQNAQAGNGLGLITAIKIAQLYDFKMEIKSELNQFFTVQLKIPGVRMYSIN